MILPYLFTNLDFAGLFRFVSPNFFKVVSPAALFKIAPQLRRNYADAAGFEALRSRTLRRIAKSGLGPTGQPGEHALQLFFFQILTQDTWILDFRAEAFPEGTEAAWSPKPLYYEISPAFLKGVRDMYQGFYGGDDELFDRALGGLGLLPARECLRNHFGTGDQTRVRFELQTFQNTFAEVFQVCDREGLSLQTEFFVLGLMLLSLYQNLETRDVPFNVRACYEAAAKAAFRK